MHVLGGRSSMVAVAQLVESRIVIPVVVGSSPISHPIDQAVTSFSDLRRYSELDGCVRIRALTSLRQRNISGYHS